MRTTSKKSSKSSQKKVTVKRVALSVTRRMPKPRAGFETMVEKFAALVEKFGPLLGPGLDVELMRSSLSAYQSLEPDHQAALDHLASVDSTRSFQASTSWVQMLIIYDRLRSVARINTDVEAALEPLEHFFRVGPRKSVAPVPVTTTTP